MADLIRFTPLPTIKELLKLYNLRALRQLSQNFLLDLRVTNKIVKAAGDLTDCEVCEIGPGPGGITRSILLTPVKKLTIIEKDTRFFPILEALQNTVKNRLQVVYADILDYDLSEAFDKDLKKDWDDVPPNIHLIGNLPFNIANILIIKYLKDISLRRNAWTFGRVPLTLTFQDEVAMRITSEILSKSRSRLSVMCQNWCNVSYKFKIPGRAFLPKPDVDVGIVHFEPLVRPIIDLEFHLVEKVVGTIFNSRQKHSLTPAMQLFPTALRKKLGKELFELADLEQTLRPFQISNEEWMRLCFAYKHICDRDPKLYSYNYRASKNSREQSWLEEVEMEASQGTKSNINVDGGCSGEIRAAASIAVALGPSESHGQFAIGAIKDYMKCASVATNAE